MALLKRYKWLPLALIVFLQITILILSPAERTLGNGIKPVYLHVSLTWTGMVFFLISAIFGIVVFFSESNWYLVFAGIRQS